MIVKGTQKEIEGEIKFGSPISTRMAAYKDGPIEVFEAALLNITHYNYDNISKAILFRDADNKVLLVLAQLKPNKIKIPEIT